MFAIENFREYDIVWAGSLGSEVTRCLEKKVSSF